MDTETFPEETVFEFAPLDQIRSSILQTAFDHWTTIRRARCFPARHELRPRAMASAMAHMVLIKVLDGGADFEFRIVGDVAARSFAVPRQNRKLSEIAVSEPHQAMRLASLYRFCVDSKRPILLRGTIGHDAHSAKFTHFEALVLPMGPSDDVVDHVLGFGIYEKGSGAR